MNTTKLFVLFFFILITNAFTQTFIPPGAVSGTWTSSGSPYYIQGEITVPNTETLSIEPGVNVIFLGHYKFNIQGRLLAIGTQLDSIHFTAENTDSGWHGIRFMDTPNTNDTSKIVYCSFRYGKANTGSVFDRCGGAILIKFFDKVIVSNCLFDHNMQSGDGEDPPEAGPAIYIWQASPIITRSKFTYNTGSKGSAIFAFSENAIIANNLLTSNHGGLVAPIVAYGEGSPIISRNIVFNNTSSGAAGGISIELGSSARIENNIIYHNYAYWGAGIFIWTDCKPIIINNTISYNYATNGGGILCEINSDPIFINNIIYGNTATSGGNQVWLNDTQSDPHFLFCDIQGGKEGFGGSGAGGNYSGLYENNIDTIPYFLDINGDDFQLSDYSPCIGAGIDSIEIASIWYYAPPFCIEGNPRPNPPGSMPDIGACENYLGIPLVDVENELNQSTEFLLSQNFPNPFNPSTTFIYSIPNESKVIIKVYDILGKEIETLVNEEKPAGSYEITWSAASLTSGVYFYQLKACEFIAMKKMILLK
jgi:hypothetical protein